MARAIMLNMSLHLLHLIFRGTLGGSFALFCLLQMKKLKLREGKQFTQLALLNSKVNLLRRQVSSSASSRGWDFNSEQVDSKPLFR